MDQYRLKLYVTGRSARAQATIDNLSRLLEEQFSGQYELQVIDVLDDPGRAEENKILATPTLVRELPAPIRRVIGDLSDQQQVLMGLDLEPISPNDDGESAND